MTKKSFELAVIIGRFQIFHNAHLELLQTALQNAQQVVIVIGSAGQARTGINPFSWQERQQMIISCLSQQQQQRVFFVPLRDYHSMQRWCLALVTQVQQIAKQQQPPISDAQISLFGYMKDADTGYLANFPQWQFTATKQYINANGIEQSATELRKMYFSQNDDSKLQQYVNNQVFKWLLNWRNTNEYALVKQYWHKLQYIKFDNKLSHQLYLLVQAEEKFLLLHKKQELSSADLIIPNTQLTQLDKAQQQVQQLLQHLVGINQAKIQKVTDFTYPKRLLTNCEIGYLYCAKLEYIPKNLASDLIWLEQDKLLQQSQRLANDGLNMLLEIIEQYQ